MSSNYSLKDPLIGRRSARVELHSLTGGRITDITPFVSTVTVNSSLDMPFMGASVVVTDSDSIIERFEVDGDIAVKFIGFAGNDKSISGKFHINSISLAPQNNRKTNAVQFNCIAMEHIHNASQKVQEWQYWHNPKPISEIVRDIASKYLAIQPIMNSGTTAGPQNINIPKLHPMEAITMLCQRAEGHGKNIFSFYQKFDNQGVPKYYFDEVSTLMGNGEKWTLEFSESNIGQVEDQIARKYLEGEPISRVTAFNSRSFFDAHNMIKQGYPGRTYIKMDFVKKKYESIDNSLQHLVIGQYKQMPELVRIAQSNSDYYFNRALYEPFNGDSSYFNDPKLEENFKKSKPVVSGLLNKRLSVTTYGCPSIGPGDTVMFKSKQSTAGPRKYSNKDLEKKYLVYAVGHSFGVGGGKNFITELQLASDGQR